MKIKELPLLSHCKVCTKDLKGRADKKYCNLQCKNHYHMIRRKENLKHTLRTDRFLHRNRVVLVELFEKTQQHKLFISKILMLKMGFKFEIFNGSYLNKQGELFHCVYDFRWMELSNKEVMILNN